MPNDSIDAKSTRAKALGARAQALGHKGARPLMSMHARGLGIVATSILNTFLTIK